MDEYSVEYTVQIHHDFSGDRIEVGYDKDGLDLCRINYCEHELFLSWEQAELVAKAILKLRELQNN